MKPPQFNSITESREYVFSYDDSERMCIQVQERQSGKFIASEIDGNNSNAVGIYHTRPTMAQLKSLVRSLIRLRSSQATSNRVNP
jgi:hypothetical protein